MQKKKTAESSLINFLQVNIFLVGTGRCNIMKLIVYSAERLNGTRCVNFFTLRHVVISLRHSIMKNSNRNRRLTSTPKSSGCCSLRWSRNFHDIRQGSRSVRLMICPGNTALLFLRGFEFSSNFFYSAVQPVWPDKMADPGPFCLLPFATSPTDRLHLELIGNFCFSPALWYSAEMH